MKSVVGKTRPFVSWATRFRRGSEGLPLVKFDAAAAAPCICPPCHHPFVSLLYFCLFPILDVKHEHNRKCISKCWAGLTCAHACTCVNVRGCVAERTSHTIVHNGSESVTCQQKRPSCVMGCDPTSRYLFFEFSNSFSVLIMSNREGGANNLRARWLGASRSGEGGGEGFSERND